LSQNCQVSQSQSRPKILRTACTQRPAAWRQAGVSARLGRELMMMLPALYHTNLHPRLRQTACWRQVCLIAVFFVFLTYSLSKINDTNVLLFRNFSKCWTAFFQKRTSCKFTCGVSVNILAKS